MHDVKSKKLPQWANQNKYSGKALTNNNSQINIHSHYTKLIYSI